jgi:hypothetical protein
MQDSFMTLMKLLQKNLHLLQETQNLMKGEISNKLWLLSTNRKCPIDSIQLPVYRGDFPNVAYLADDFVPIPVKN